MGSSAVGLGQAEWVSPSSSNSDRVRLGMGFEVNGAEAQIAGAGAGTTWTPHVARTPGSTSTVALRSHSWAPPATRQESWMVFSSELELSATGGLGQLD
jgi:hypothetical protein